MKPTPGRVVLYLAHATLPPWPAIVVSVHENHLGDTRLELQAFPPRGQGESNCERLEAVPFVESPTGGTAYWPPREHASQPPPSAREGLACTCPAWCAHHTPM